MKRLFKLISSRLFWVIVVCGLELTMIVYIVYRSSLNSKGFLFFELLTMLLAVIILTRNEKAPYKLIWMFMLVVFPLFGAVFYLLFANKKPGKFSRKRIQKFTKDLPDTSLYLQESSRQFATSYPEYKRLSDYVTNITGMPVCPNTKVEYFAYGEDFFNDLIVHLKSAEKFIFLEYFIIGEGKWWSRILDILKEKVSEGVDVRVLYDDMGSINVLPAYYDRYLTSFGIKAIAFNRVRMHINPRMNYRDHRKILSIDGNVCYTGGVNLSDEYANDSIRFGYWKDNAIRLEGLAVWNLTLIFLRSWSVLSNTKENYIGYMPTVFPDKTDGFVQPFDDNPLDEETIAEGAYLQMINNAKRYIWITTPYLIPDDVISRALCLASQSGIDVRIITPHYPDKKSVFEVTRSNYAQLIEAGIKIYEYIPGFIHSKTFIVDDNICCIGTVNIDYRSFFLHFELSVLMYGSSVINTVKKDFLKTLELSEEQSIEKLKKISLVQRLLRVFFKIFSPAL